jgi:rhamnogalacturonyl hydrolase YesR
MFKKSRVYKFFMCALLTLSFVGCNHSPVAESEDVIDKVFSRAEKQFKILAASSPEGLSPRTLNADGSVHYVKPKDWCSGFFPGSLWYLYEYTDDEEWKKEAIRFTEPLEVLKDFHITHDLGFMVYCSYGNAYRITKDEEYKNIVIQTAETLSKRYSPSVQAIKSWDWGNWQFPVIIDNMMNLELLFEATKLTGDSKYADVAIAHANTTLKSHFREDYSSYHLVDFDSITGEIIKQCTFQGYSDSSAWARGQGWGLYGYTLCYRYTKDAKYLEQAKEIAQYYIHHPSIPEDKIPYWDFNAPNIPDEPRDASAAAVVASALLELQGYVKNDLAVVYTNYAKEILNSFASDTYLAKEGEVQGFLLKHSTGFFHKNKEIDVPLNYADYYALEALLRFKKLRMDKNYYL